MHEQRPLDDQENESPAHTAVAALPDQPVFVGREAELRRLADALRPGAGPVVTTIAGLGGAGKTALAVRAARAASDAGWFPGGVPMVDVQAYAQTDEGAVAAAVLAGLLTAAGIGGNQLPPGIEDRKALWRRVLAARANEGKAMLIVIDNATRADQVQPALPGAASHGRHRVLITSRYCLSAVQGAQRIDLGVLSEEEAVEFLIADLEAARANHTRVQDSPDAATLAKLCDYLPLALRISAGLLADDPHRTVSDLVGVLRSETYRLEELDLDGSLAVRANFDVSYRYLTPELARVFRLLSINPGPTVGTEAVAALANLSLRGAGRALGALAQAHLVDSLGAGRWRMHDLVRLYAAQRLQTGERTAAGEGLIDYYLSTTLAAERYLDPRGVTAPETRFGNRRSALDWLDVERPNLIGAVTLANVIGAPAKTVGLAAALHCYLEFRRQWQEALVTAQEALSAARQLRDRKAEWIALANLGHAHRDGRNDHEAFESHRQALDICRDTGNRSGEAYNLSALGNASAMLGQPAEAIAYNEASLNIRRELGDRYGQRITLNHLGNAYQLAGRSEEAIECYLAALQIREEMGDPLGEGRTLTNLGVAYLERGRIVDAVDCFRRDLRIACALEDRFAESFTLRMLGDAYRAFGQDADAEDCFLHALEISTELHDADGIRAASVQLGYRGDWHLPEPPARWVDEDNRVVDVQPMACYQVVRD